MINKLYIIRGWPGSGKTTKAKELLAQGLADFHYEADMYFEHNGSYTFIPSQIRKAHEWCFNSVKHWLDAEYNVVVSNTFIKAWEFEKYIALGFPYEIIECDGNFQNTHAVPEDVVTRMKNTYEKV